MSTNYPSSDLLHNKTNRGWTYYIHPLEAQADQFGKCGEVVEMWRSKKKEGPLPSWNDMDFYDFVGWHGHINLMKILHDPFDLEMKLFGVKSVDYFEYDITGDKMSAQEEVTDTVTSYDMTFFKDVSDLPGIGIAYGPAFWVQKFHRHLTLIYLPLADDYHTTTHLLSVAIESSPKVPLP